MEETLGCYVKACFIFIILIKGNGCEVETDDCVVLEDLKLMDDNYEPIYCPLETNNQTLKELIFDCYNDIFRDCTGKQILICRNDTSRPHKKIMKCEIINGTVKPEVPVISIETITPTSINLSVLSSNNGHSVTSYFKLIMLREGSSEKKVMRMSANNNGDSSEFRARFEIKKLNSSTDYFIEIEARTSDGYFSSAMKNLTTPDEHQTLDGGEIAGIVVGAFVFIIAIIIPVIICMVRKQRRDNGSFQVSQKTADSNGVHSGN